MKREKKVIIAYECVMAVSWEVEVKCIMGVPPASLSLRTHGLLS